jgi:SAM-dependent MidA family methyltransferase
MRWATAVQRYTIVDLSGSLRARQQARWPALRTSALGGRAARKDSGRGGGQRGAGCHARASCWRATVGSRAACGMSAAWWWLEGSFAWADRPTALRPPVDIEGPQDYLTEIHAQGEGFIRMLADRWSAARPFLLDYGFGESEYYHPQRHMGTVMCHQGHLADGDPLVEVGLKDITAHVNFTAMALAAQEPGMQVLGYTTQAHFLINCGLLPKMELLAQAERATAAKLIMEHEMGELFKVLALGKGDAWDALGFAHGDRSHRL